MMASPSTARHWGGGVFVARLLVAGSTHLAAGIPEALLGPPSVNGPVVVRAQFQLQDINSIDDEPETFEFTGILVLTWKDPRQAFDPKVAGVQEKIYQGDCQFNEVSPAWYPPVVLANRRRTACRARSGRKSPCVKPRRGPAIGPLKRGIPCQDPPHLVPHVA